MVSSICHSRSREIPAAFAHISAEAIHAAVQVEWAEAPPGLDPALVRHLGECSDCSNDVLWLVEIRDELDAASYPCLHIAYGASSAANHLIHQQHGVYVIRTGGDAGIVIGFCPWCGLELNVAALPNP